MMAAMRSTPSLRVASIMLFSLLMLLGCTQGYVFNVGPSRYDPKFAQSLSQKSVVWETLWTPSSSKKDPSLLPTLGNTMIREPMRMMPQQTPMVPYMVSASILAVGCLRHSTP
jgi:hypothetical protein